MCGLAPSTHILLRTAPGGLEEFFRELHSEIKAMIEKTFDRRDDRSGFEAVSRRIAAPAFCSSGLG